MANFNANNYEFSPEVFSNANQTVIDERHLNGIQAAIDRLNQCVFSSTPSKDNFKNLDKINSLKDSLTKYITSTDLDNKLNGYITMLGLDNKLANYATNESLAGYATNESLANYATNESLAGYATNESLMNYATNESLTNYILTNSLIDVIEDNVKKDLSIDDFDFMNLISNINEISNGDFDLKELSNTVVALSETIASIAWLEEIKRILGTFEPVENKEEITSNNVNSYYVKDNENFVIAKVEDLETDKEFFKLNYNVVNNIKNDIALIEDDINNNVKSIIENIKTIIGQDGDEFSPSTGLIKEISDNKKNIESLWWVNDIKDDFKSYEKVDNQEVNLENVYNYYVKLSDQYQVADTYEENGEYYQLKNDAIKNLKEYVGFQDFVDYEDKDTLSSKVSSLENSKNETNNEINQLKKLMEDYGLRLTNENLIYNPRFEVLNKRNFLRDEYTSGTTIPNWDSGIINNIDTDAKTYAYEYYKIGTKKNESNNTVMAKFNNNKYSFGPDGWFISNYVEKQTITTKDENGNETEEYINVPTKECVLKSYQKEIEQGKKEHQYFYMDPKQNFVESGCYMYQEISSETYNKIKNSDAVCFSFKNKRPRENDEKSYYEGFIETNELPDKWSEGMPMVSKQFTGTLEGTTIQYGFGYNFIEAKVYAFIGFSYDYNAELGADKLREEFGIDFIKVELGKISTLESDLKYYNLEEEKKKCEQIFLKFNPYIDVIADGIEVETEGADGSTTTSTTSLDYFILGLANSFGKKKLILTMNCPNNLFKKPQVFFNQLYTTRDYKNPSQTSSSSSAKGSLQKQLTEDLQTLIEIPGFSRHMGILNIYLSFNGSIIISGSPTKNSYDQFTTGNSYIVALHKNGHMILDCFY